MGSIVVVGNGKHNRATCIHWRQPFLNIEEFDSLIVDLTSFPKDELTVDLLNKLEELREVTTTFISTGREIFCIIDEPLSSQMSNLNYFWVPGYSDLSIIRKKTGKSKKVINERFAEYLAFVENWKYEIKLESIFYEINSICVNKSGNDVASTITSKLIHGNGKIYLLPKTTKMSVSDSIELLIDLALGKEITEYPWRNEIEIPGLQKIESEIDVERGKIDSIRKKIEKLKLKWKNQESYRDIFSKDDNKVPKATQRILGDLGIRTKETVKGYVVDLINQKVAVEVTSIKGKVNAKTKKVNQLSRFIEEEKKEEKVIFVANTYKELPVKERVGKEHITRTMEKFLKSVHVCFMTTLTLYQLWSKVLRKEMSARKAASVILEKEGSLQI